MRIGVALVLGVAAGIVVGWLWGREIEASVGEKAREVGAKAAEGVRAVGETTEQALDRAGDALRRAGAFVHDTQEHVSEALRVGQETMRPPSTT